MVRKKVVSLIMAVAMTAVLGAGNITYGEDTVGLDLNAMMDKLVSESTEIKNIEINRTLLDVKYEKRIKDYNDFKEKSIKMYEKDMLTTKAMLDAKKEEFSKGGGDSMRGYIEAALTSYRYSRERYKSIIESYVTQLKSMEPVILQKSQADRQKAAETDKLKYTFKKDFYDFMALSRQLELTKTDLELLTKQINVEVIKKENGMSTDVNIEELEKQKRDLEVGIKDLENSTEMYKETIKTKLNIGADQDFKVAFKLPENLFNKDYALKEIINKFSELNLEYETIKNSEFISKDAYESYKLAYSYDPGLIAWEPSPSEDEQNNLKAAELEFEKAKNDTLSTKKSMDLYAERTYYNYKKAQLNLNHNLDTRKLLKQKADILEVNYAQGLISKLQYEVQKQDLTKKEFEIDKAIISFEMAKTQMEMLVNGVWLR